MQVGISLPLADPDSDDYIPDELIRAVGKGTLYLDPREAVEWVIADWGGRSGK